MKAAPTLARIFSILLLGLLLPTGSLQAQDSADGEESTPPAGTEVAQAPAAPKPAPVASAPRKQEDDPDSYESTEEISEDLSVSYPVDI